MTRASRLLLALAVVVLAAGVAWPFFASATFFGDDHVFLAFARLEPHPFRPFVADLHGGEYYRPVPMALWWVLGRAGGGGVTPYAVAAFALHAGASYLVGACLRDHADRATAALAGALFFLAPATRDAALWFSASTDLLATVGVLGALWATRRGRPVVAAALGALALASKESAIVLPALVAADQVLAPERGARPWRAVARRAAPAAALALAYLAARTAVLRGWGGAGDERAFLADRFVQSVGGLAEAIAGAGPWSRQVSLVVGLVALAALATFALVSVRRGGRSALWPVAWVALAIVPLLAAGWVVGSRYFYLPMVGVAWLAARALASRGVAVVTVVLATLAAQGIAYDLQRQHDVAVYDARCAAAKATLLEAAAAGHRVIHLAAGIKDVDLVLKSDPTVAALAPEPLVLCDVPASFVLMPEDLAAAASLLVAAPPLPPSGAYRFGGRRIVGLARRDDAPDLVEVVAKLPGIRFMKLEPAPGGGFRARDRTDELLHDAEEGGR